MSQKSIILVGILFSLIVVGMFVYAHLKKAEIEQIEVVEDVPEEEVLPYADIKRIDAKHYFADGVHTLVGEVNMPTPCDLLVAEALVGESFPEQIQINFSVVNNSEACIQVMTPQRFKVEATASEGASFRAQLMGRPVELNLIPAATGELPEDFEVFIKG